MIGSRIFLLLSWVAWVSLARAEVRPARIFQDHMVLQREQPVEVWGQAAPGESVTVTFAGQSRSVVADAEGRWQIQLAPMTAHVHGTVLEIRGANVLSFEDVVVGEVWYASGQSNMAMDVGAMARGLGLPGVQLMAAADLPALRFRRVSEPNTALPQADLTHDDPWVVCHPSTVASFSAVAFVFAWRLHAELQVPIGIMDGSWGGKPIESFIPREAFKGHPVLEKERELADRGDLAGLKRMEGGVFARDDSWLPGAIYNARVAPLRAFTLRGVIWYQGESNCGTGEDPRYYHRKMRALVQSWRETWARPELPFYYVQLPAYVASVTGWPFLREEQRLSLTIPKTGMAVAIDLLSEDIHPPNKIDVGERLARWALAKDYGKSIPFSGPLYDQMRVQGGSVTLQFRCAEDGLMTGIKDGIAPVRETPGVNPEAFEIAGSDHQWHSAEARIIGDTVVVSSDAVAKPVAVRYGYDPTGRGCHLYNRQGLPASPFCTHPELLVWEGEGRKKNAE